MIKNVRVSVSLAGRDSMDESRARNGTEEERYPLAVNGSDCRVKELVGLSWSEGKRGMKVEVGLIIGLVLSLRVEEGLIFSLKVDFGILVRFGTDEVVTRGLVLRKDDVTVGEALGILAVFESV